MDLRSTDTMQRWTRTENYYHPPHKGTILKVTTVQVMNWLRPLNKWTVCQLAILVTVYNSHICAPLINKLRLASPIYEWNIVAPWSFHRYGELHMASCTNYFTSWHVVRKTQRVCKTFSNVMRWCLCTPIILPVTLGRLNPAHHPWIWYV